MIPGSHLSKPQQEEIKNLVDPVGQTIIKKAKELKDDLAKDLTAGVNYLVDAFVPSSEDSWFDSGAKVVACSSAAYLTALGAYRAAPEIAMLLAKSTFFGSVGLGVHLYSQLNDAKLLQSVRDEQVATFSPLISALMQLELIKNKVTPPQHVTKESVITEINRCLGNITDYFKSKTDGKDYQFSKELINHAITTLKTKVFAETSLYGTNSENGSSVTVSSIDVIPEFESAIRAYATTNILAQKRLEEKTSFTLLDLKNDVKELASHLGAETPETLDIALKALLTEALTNDSLEGYRDLILENTLSTLETIESERSLDSFLPLIKGKGLDTVKSLTLDQVNTQYEAVIEVGDESLAELAQIRSLFSGELKLEIKPGAEDGTGLSFIERDVSEASEAQFKSDLTAELDNSTIEFPPATPAIDFTSDPIKTALFSKLKDALEAKDKDTFFAAFAILPTDFKEDLRFKVWNAAGKPEIDNYGTKTLNSLKVEEAATNLKPFSDVLTAINQVLSEIA